MKRTSNSALTAFGMVRRRALEPRRPRSRPAPRRTGTRGQTPESLNARSRIAPSTARDKAQPRISGRSVYIWLSPTPRIGAETPL